MGFLDNLKWKMTEVKYDLEMKAIDFRYGDAKEKAKIAGEAGLLLYNPLLFVTAKGVKKVIDNKVDKIKEDTRRETRVELKAEHLAEINKLKKVIEEMTPTEFYNFNVAGAALAFAAANCDGDFSEEERNEILPLLLGESVTAIPENLEKIFAQFIESPPTFEEALLYVEKVDKSLWNSFDGIIEMTINLDNKIEDEEKILYFEWMEFKKKHGVD